MCARGAILGLLKSNGDAHFSHIDYPSDTSGFCGGLPNSWGFVIDPQGLAWLIGVLDIRIPKSGTESGDARLAIVWGN